MPDSAIEEVPYHANPTVYRLALAPGQRSLITVRYWNFCGDPRAEFLGTEWVEPSEALTVVETPRPGARFGLFDERQGFSVRFAFEAAEPGAYSGALRTLMSHGYYDTVVEATVAD